MSPVFRSPSELRAAIGTTIGPGNPTLVHQEMIDDFARVTGDHQWIHVDPARAATGPFGTTVAHGYLTLSLSPLLGQGLFEIEGTRLGINYGLDRVRFPAPLRVGTSVAGEAVFLKVEDLPGNGVQLTVRFTVRPEGEERPVCVSDQLRRYYW